MDEHPNKKAFYQRLATWCLLSPLISFAILFGIPIICFKVPALKEQDAIHSIRIDIKVTITILVLGIVIGITSMLKARIYGRKGILWKTIVGLPLSLFLLVSVIVMGIGLGMFTISFKPRLRAPSTEIKFDGSSDQLQATQIAPTLDTPIQNGRNAIWCASFISAWKTMEQDLGSSPLLEPQSNTAASLNNAGDPRPDIPADALYTAVGSLSDGIIDKINRELHQKFPAKTPPVFPNSHGNAYVAYSYLEATIHFPLPYFQNRKPLLFTDSSGKQSKLSSFGIREEDDYAYPELRAQVKVLFRGNDIVGTVDHNIVRNNNYEFAVDLSRSSSPSEIVIARISHKQTLADAIAYVGQEVTKRTESYNKDQYGYFTQIGTNDVLLVPDIFWQISHHFTEMEGLEFKNTKLLGQQLDVAQEDIRFRLDRSGAELSAEGKLRCLPMPSHFILDRPFLIYMKKRGASKPYFAMWIDNAELLCGWKSDEHTK